MKGNIFAIPAALALLAAGCAATPVAVAPIGPNPAVLQSTASNGQLEVFSALSGRREGDNPTWYQHTGYYIYSRHGRPLEHVNNTVGYYSQAPSIVALPPGKYIVEARAKDALCMKVPVVIKAGEITRVHLDGDWQPSSGASGKELVRAPGGYPIGWRASAVKGIGGG